MSYFLNTCRLSYFQEGRELPLLRDVSANDKSDLNVSKPIFDFFFE